MNQAEARARGVYDAQRNKPPIFRQVGKRLEATIDDDMADEWDQEVRQAYLDGYDDVPDYSF